MKEVIRRLSMLLLTTMFFVSQLPVVAFTQESITCQECDAKNPASTKFCKDCGTRIIQPKPKAQPIAPSELKCHNCETVNPPGTKFCKECGTKLIAIREEPKEIKCSDCGTINLPGVKFCKECGFTLPRVKKIARRRREKDPVEAVWRSTLLPGWGQFYNSQKTKGYVFAGGTAVLVLTSFLMYNTAENTYNEYRKGKASYDDYSRQIDTTNILIGVTAVIWLYNIVDAYVSAQGKIPEETYFRKNVLSLATNKEKISLVYVTKF